MTGARVGTKGKGKEGMWAKGAAEDLLLPAAAAAAPGNTTTTTTGTDKNGGRGRGGHHLSVHGAGDK